MTQLTREHLDKALNKHFKKVDQRFEKIDGRFDAQTKELKTEIAQVAGQVEDLAGIVQRRFDEVELKLDVRVRVEKVERDVRVIKQALHLTK